VVLGGVLLVAACGGRSRNESELPSTGGRSGATAGTAGSVVIGSGAATTGGTGGYSKCGRLVPDYLARSTIPDACNGPSGPLALFESSPEQLILGENAAYVRVERFPGTVVDGWAIDTRTGAVSLAPPWAELVNAPGVVVSGPQPIEVAGVKYSRATNGMLVAGAGDETRQLFELPGYEPAFIVVATELYSSSYDGGLHRGLVDPVVLPELIEQRGELDDDDHIPSSSRPTRMRSTGRQVRSRMFRSPTATPRCSIEPAADRRCAQRRARLS
jgi:hypothetical protein